MFTFGEDNIMEDIKKLEQIYGLKNIYRVSLVKDRKESVPEHCWSSLLLADYFIQKIGLNIHKEKVYDLIIYHDLVELKTGDIPLHDTEMLKQKKGLEMDALPDVLNNLPSSLQERVKLLLSEFDASETLEAKFANAIDKLDPMIQCVYDKQVWLKYNFSEEMVRKSKDKYMVAFPEIQEMYEKLITFYKENGYFG